MSRRFCFRHPAILFPSKAAILHFNQLNELNCEDVLIST